MRTDYCKIEGSLLDVDRNEWFYTADVEANVVYSCDAGTYAEDVIVYNIKLEHEDTVIIAAKLSLMPTEFPQTEVNSIEKLAEKEICEHAIEYAQEMRIARNSSE